MEQSSKSPYMVAYCTCPPSRAEEIARLLVSKRVCACVNVVPGLRSFYRWKGAVEEDEEALLVIKTRADRLDALESAVAAVHPYEVFELVASRLESGSEPYLRWIDDCLAPDR